MVKLVCAGACAVLEQVRSGGKSRSTLSSLFNTSLENKGCYRLENVLKNDIRFITVAMIDAKCLKICVQYNVCSRRSI